MTIAEFISKYNNSSTGLFKDNSSRDISEADVRELVADISTLTDIPIDFSGDFWPLTGAADITGSVTLDGNDFDLIFGSPNPLNNFQVYADNGILFDYDDGASQSSFEISDIIQISAAGASLFFGESVGVGTVQATASHIVQFFADDGIGNSSTLSLEVDHYHLDLGDAHIHSDGDSISLEMDDGVDTASLNILPDSIDFATGDFGVTGFADFLLDVTSGIQIIYYDDLLNASSILFGVAGEMNISGVTGTIDFDDLLIGGTVVGFDIPVKLKTYTVAGGLPDPSIYQDALIVVTDESGGRTPAYSDGTNWRRLYDMNIVS